MIMLPSFDDWLEQRKKPRNIEQIIDSHHFVFYFTKDDDVYGSDEDGRLAFAKLKNPDGDIPKPLQKELKFSAFNITRFYKEGYLSQTLFGKKDLSKIKIIDKDKVASYVKKG